MTSGQRLLGIQRTRGFPGGASVESANECRRPKRYGLYPWVGKIPCSRKWHPTSVFLPGKFPGQRSLTGYSPWGCKSQKWLSTHYTKRQENMISNEDKKVIFRSSLVVQWIRICMPCRGHRFNPWLKRIPHATEQLSLCSQQEKLPQWEASAQ